MAKAHDPSLKARWNELHAQSKNGTLTKSKMLTEHNKAVTALLQDPHWNRYYSSMAKRSESDDTPSSVAEIEGEHDSSTVAFEFVPYAYVRFFLPPSTSLNKIYLIAHLPLRWKMG